MPSSVLLAEFLLPKAAVSLGRFVTNVDEPHQDFHDPETDRGPYIAEKFQSEYNGAHSIHNQRTFASELTRFLSASLSKRRGRAIRITSDEVKTYSLYNSGEWFRDAVRAEKTRRWIERIIDEGEKMYVVTGFYTLLDARIREQAQEKRGASGKLVLPVSAALAASGIVAPVGDICDPGITASNESTEGEWREFVANGEQICAVQYRKIRCEWFSSKNVEKMKLANSRWKRYDVMRSVDDFPDMVEVDLEEGATLDTTRDSFVKEDGETIFASSRNDFED